MSAGIEMTDEKGMSLLEVLISLAMLGVIVMAGTRVMTNSFQAAKLNQNMYAENDIPNYVTDIIRGVWVRYLFDIASCDTLHDPATIPSFPLARLYDPVTYWFYNTLFRAGASDFTYLSSSAGNPGYQLHADLFDKCKTASHTGWDPQPASNDSEINFCYRLSTHQLQMPKSVSYDPSKPIIIEGMMQLRNLVEDTRVTCSEFLQNFRQFSGIETGIMLRYFIYWTDSTGIMKRMPGTALLSLDYIPSPWTNSAQPLDVNADGCYWRTDLSALADYIHQNAVPMLVPITKPRGDLFYDVNRDGWIDNKDYLLLKSRVRASPVCQ